MTKELKQGIHCLLCKATNLLQQRLVFPFDKRIETMERLLTMQGQKIVETTVKLDFPFEKRIKTTDRLPTMQGKQSVETTVRFSNPQKN